MAACCIAACCNPACCMPAFPCTKPTGKFVHDAAAACGKPFAELAGDGVATATRGGVRNSVSVDTYAEATGVYDETLPMLVLPEHAALTPLCSHDERHASAAAEKAPTAYDCAGLGGGGMSDEGQPLSGGGEAPACVSLDAKWSPAARPSAVAAFNRWYLLRTASPERPGMASAIFFHLNPTIATPCGKAKGAHLQFVFHQEMYKDHVGA
eukprot:6200484-Pleurochrysis_carterae.AAC.2